MGMDGRGIPENMVPDEHAYLFRHGKQPVESSLEATTAMVTYEEAYTFAISDASRSQASASSYTMQRESIQTNWIPSQRAR